MNTRSQLYQKQKIQSIIGKNSHMTSSLSHSYRNEDNPLCSINSKTLKQQKLTGLYKHIGKANQLVKDTPLPLSILYSEIQEWNFDMQHNRVPICKGNQQQNVFSRRVAAVHRDRQLKNMNQNSKKVNYGNLGYTVNSFKNICRQNFGKLVYDRFIGKIGNSWKINANQAKGISIMSDNFQKGTSKQQNSEMHQQTQINVGYQKVHQDQQYQFDSKFQSGNLQKVYKFERASSEKQRSSTSYNLFLQNDTNTLGYNQWFYFKVKNLLAYQTIQLSIVNLRKGQSLHQQGMKIAILSKKKLEKYRVGWQRGGSNIQYYQNGYVDDYNNKFYTLLFEHTFEYANDDVYFALAYPYTYQQMREDIYKLTAQGFLRFKKIGFSVMKNEIIMIMPKQSKKEEGIQLYNDSKDLNQANDIKKRKKSQIIPETSKLRNRGRMNPINSISIQNRFEKSFKTVDHLEHPKLKKGYNSLFSTKTREILKKPFILIMARVHPCETMSSFVMQGIIENLFQKGANQTPQCKYLLSKFNIRLIPMINPDGVVHGNSRTSVVGCDLNRRWRNPSPVLQPQVFAIKKYLESLKQQGNQIFSIIDLHGHSKKQSCFFYGACQSSKNFQDFYNIKLFNAIMGQIEENFTREYSSFYVSQSKAGTARVTCSRNLSPFSYTLQSSYLGRRDSQYHFSVQDYKNIGKNVLFSLAYFHQTLYPNVWQLSPILRQDFKQKILQQKQNIKRSEQIKEDNKSDDSSSNPSLYNFPQQVINKNLIPNKLTLNLNQKKQTRYANIRIVQTSRRESPDISSKINQCERIQRKYTIQKKKKAIVIDQLQFTKQKTNESVYQLYNFKSRRIFPKKSSAIFPLIKQSDTQTSEVNPDKLKQ